jgi:hypothetical protein
MMVRRHGEWRGTGYHVGKEGPALVSAMPLGVAWHEGVRRHGEWRDTLGLGLPAQPRACLLSHFLPHLFTAKAAAHHNVSSALHGALRYTSVPNKQPSYKSKTPFFRYNESKPTP